MRLRGHSSRHRLYVKSVGSFVPKLAQKAFEKYGFSTVALLTDWAIIVGAEFGTCTRPERLKWPRKVSTFADIDVTADKGRPGATLVLRVDPSRALEVQYGADQLIERINCYFGYQAVTRIQILQAPINPTTTPHAKTPPTPTRSTSVREAVGPNSNAAQRLDRAAKSRNQPTDQRLSAALDRFRATFPDDPGTP